MLGRAGVVQGILYRLEVVLAVIHCAVLIGAQCLHRLTAVFFPGISWTVKLRSILTGGAEGILRGFTE